LVEPSPLTLLKPCKEMHIHFSKEPKCLDTITFLCCFVCLAQKAIEFTRNNIGERGDWKILKVRSPVMCRRVDQAIISPINSEQPLKSHDICSLSNVPDLERFLCRVTIKVSH